MSDAPPVDAAAVRAFFAAQFPRNDCIVDHVDAASATIRHPVGIDQLRPGGTVSGPVLMTVADVALYAAILGRIGIVPLAVTVSLTVNFLRRPSARADIVGVATLMKVGRTLVVGDVWLSSDGDPQPVAHAVGTYALPPGWDAGREPG